MKSTTLIIALFILFQISLNAQSSNLFSTYELKQLVSSGAKVIIGKPLSAYDIKEITSANSNLVTVNTRGFSVYEIKNS